MQDKRIRDVFGMFLVGVFGLALLLFTAIANLNLLMSVYPDPQFVGFGLLALEGGTLGWTIVYFLTSPQAHKGLCVVGIVVDTLISFVGFMYEMAAKTHTTFPFQPPVIYVVGIAVVFNISLGLCYKLIPSGTRIEYIPPTWAQWIANKVAGSTRVQVENADNQVDYGTNQLELVSNQLENVRLLTANLEEIKTQLEKGTQFTHNLPQTKPWGGKREGAGRKKEEE